MTQAHASAQTPPTDPAPTSARISLIGLGAMGTALGQAFVAAGHDTTVWNRTPSRAAPLVRQGAVLAPNAAAAITASEVTVLNLLDADAVRTVLQTVPAGDLHGRALINLTSSTPREARGIAELVRTGGADYLDGAIMVPTPMIGADDALLIFSGDRRVLEDHGAVLSAAAGRLQWLGEDPGLAAVYDLGMLDLYLTGMAGFLHAAALVEAEGVSVGDFLPYAAGITDVLRDTLPGLADHVAAGSYPGDEDTTAMELAVADHIVATSHAGGIGTAVPDLIRTLLQRAVDGGHADHSFSSIFEQFRAGDPT